MYIKESYINMHRFSKRARITITIITIIAIILCAFGVYKYQKIRLFDKSEYKELCSNLELDGEQFDKQSDLRDYITHWADENELKYHLDDADNIIFERSAAARKKSVSPTVFIVNYNYDNAVGNRKVLAGAAMVALTELDSGKSTVVFVNNEKNDGSAYAALDPSIFDNKAKVIYLDYGKQTYISTRSYAQLDEQVIVPAETEEVNCDTAIKIRIGGIKSDVIDTGITKHTNPISSFSTILTRLKTKSTISQIADIKVKNKGYMYPTGIEFTVLLNSYSVEGFISYLDKRVEAFEKANSDDNPECYYEYEVLDNDSDEFPSSAYSKATFEKLTTTLYALKNGVYRYEEYEEVPEGYQDQAIYGITCVRQLTANDDSIVIDLTSQAMNSEKMSALTRDNAAAAELAGCSIVKMDGYDVYENKKDGLVRTLRTTYFKVNDITGNNVTLNEYNDTYFTPMTFISKINSKLDIVHVKYCSKTASVLTNMLLCYLETKGNFLSL